MPINAILSTFRGQNLNLSVQEISKSGFSVLFPDLHTDTVHSHDHRQLLKTALRLWRPAPRAV